MCESPEAAASQPCPAPAGPALLLLCHTSTETTLGNDSFTFSAHISPGFFPDTHGRGQCPNFTQNESPSRVSWVKLCLERAKAKLFRGHGRKTDHEYLKLPHQTPPTAPQSFLPSPQTSVLPNDSLISQIIQNSRTLAKLEHSCFLLTIVSSIFYMLCFL